MPKCAYFWIKMKWGTRALHRVALFNIQSTVIPIPHSNPPTQTPAVAASQKLNTYLAPDQVLIFEEDSFPCPNWGWYPLGKVEEEREKEFEDWKAVAFQFTWYSHNQTISRGSKEYRKHSWNCRLKPEYKTFCFSLDSFVLLLMLHICSLVVRSIMNSHWGVRSDLNSV